MDYYKEIVINKKCSVDLSCSGKLAVAISDTKTRWLGWSFSPEDTEKIRKALNEAYEQRKGDKNVNKDTTKIHTYIFSQT